MNQEIREKDAIIQELNQEITEKSDRIDDLLQRLNNLALAYQKLVTKSTKK